MPTWGIYAAADIMSKLLVFLSIFVFGIAINAQPTSTSDRFSTIDEVAGHRVILYNVPQMKSMKHLPFYVMNEKGKLKQVKEAEELAALTEGCLFDEEAAVEHVKKDTYLKLVKGGNTYYIIIDAKDNPFLPEGLRNYDYWTDMMAEFRETYTYREMSFKNSSMYNEGEEAGKYASVTWTKIDVPNTKDEAVTFSYVAEGNTTQKIIPTEIDHSVFLTDKDVEVAKHTLAEGMKVLEKYKQKYEYIDINKSKGFRYAKNDLLVEHYLPIKWENAFLPKGSHDTVKYRLTAGTTTKDYSDSELANSGFMSTDDVVRIEIGEEWVDVAYKENDDESNVLQTPEPVKAIQVDGFDLDQGDLTAMQQGTSVLDKDGNRCALIKIGTKESDLTFDVGAQGIAKTEHKTGEEWLYVPSGIRTIQITHPQFGSYQYVIPRKVEKGRTYNMQLSFDKKTETKRKGEITQGLKDAVQRYDEVYGFHNGLAYVKNYGYNREHGVTNGVGVINKDGCEILPCGSAKYNAIGEGLIVVIKDGKYGYVDTSGNLVIPYQYDSAERFSEGLAPVAKMIDGHKKWGVIDRSGKLNIDYKYDLVTSGFNHGVAAFGEGDGGCDKSTLINIKGEEISPVKYYRWYQLGDPEINYDERCVLIDGMMLVENYSGDYGIIDSTGNVIVPCQYCCDANDSPMSRPGYKSIHHGYAYLQNYLFDKTGNIVLKDVCSGLYEGLVMICRNDKYGFVTLSGKVIIPPIYDAAMVPHEGMIAVGQYADKIVDSEKIKWGFINRLGKQIVPCVYSKVESYSEGYSAVCKLFNKKHKWGYMDLSGKMISDFKYDTQDYSRYGEIYGNSFSGGLVVVYKRDQGTGYMDRYGNDTFEE